VRYGVLVGLVGLVQIAVTTPMMVSARDAVRCVIAAQDPTFQGLALQAGHLPSCAHGPTPVDGGGLSDTVSPQVDALGDHLALAYLLSVVPLFVLYARAGGAARRATGARRSGAAAAVLAALVGGVLYSVADVIRMAVLFSPFLFGPRLPFTPPTSDSPNMGNAPGPDAGSNEVITLFFWLALLVACAALLGLLGARKPAAAAGGVPADLPAD
jgi:hypothetical protein